MDQLFTRLQTAVRLSDHEAALKLIGELRREGEALTALRDTVECLLIELDASTEGNRFQRFAERVRAGFDHDIDK